jgi:hypothetical protein
MDRHEVNEELSAPGAQELLTTTAAAHLAYTGRDGTPRVIPIGFYWTGSQVIMATATTSPKVAALSARPDVAVSIDAGNTPGGARALSIRGRAGVEIVDGVVEEYLAMARISMGPMRPPSSRGGPWHVTSRWRASRSRRTGHASTTSAPDARPAS